ncbi:MAG: hypothetical protein ABI552_14895 [Casimicrobiaceae bacterium]
MAIFTLKCVPEVVKIRQPPAPPNLDGVLRADAVIGHQIHTKMPAQNVPINF